MIILIATRNLHKLNEYKALFKEFFPDVEILSLKDFPDYSILPDSGDTFEDRATSRALHANRNLNIPVLADNSGIVVPALNNKPGLESRIYARVDASEKQNRDKLLEDMSHLKGEERSAYFECSVVLALDGEIQKCVIGRCEGEVVAEEAGYYGSGYDPIFRKYGYNQTFGQVPINIKNKISHRGKAFAKLVPKIGSLTAIRN